VKAILSGEGADEAFIGYSWDIFNLRAYVRHLPGHVLRRLMNLLRRRAAVSAPETAAAMVRGLHNRFEIDLERARTRAELRRKLGSNTSPRELTTLDNLGYHLRTLLHRNDCLGMAASVEARFPFLDTRLIRLAVNLPYTVKVRPSITTLEPGHPFLRDKWILRKVAERYLPPSLAWRPKRGFPIGAPGRMRIAPEFFDASFVARLFELGARETHFMASQADRGLRLRMLHLDVWGRVCLEGQPTDDVTARLQKYVTLD
jgi:asparagine synthase (glutamine-hydrolysing)